MNTSTNSATHSTTSTADKFDQLLEFKLQGARYLAKVIDTMPDGNWRLKAAIALTRLTIPAPPRESRESNSPSLREGAGGRVGASPRHPVLKDALHNAETSASLPGRSAEAAAPAPC